jgi:DNA-binding MarR family transcriptional regulator
MSGHENLGELLEAFINRASHRRGRSLALMAEASVTVPQVILLNFALNIPNSTPSTLASIMQISLPSASQMIDRLVKLGLAERIEDAEDRRRKTIRVTSKARTFLRRLQQARSSEYAAAMANLSPATRKILKDALAQALQELTASLRSRVPELRSREESPPGTG